MRHLQASTCIGLGIAGMHYIGMAAMQSDAIQYYHPDFLIVSIVIAVAASLAALALARHFRNGSGVFHQQPKYMASLLI